MSLIVIDILLKRFFYFSVLLVIFVFSRFANLTKIAVLLKDLVFPCKFDFIVLLLEKSN